MNKTYIANNNHPFLKEGIQVHNDKNNWVYWVSVSRNWTGQVYSPYTPEDSPEWYDEEIWKPKNEETYWIIQSTGNVYPNDWTGHYVDEDYYEIGNCYKTKEEAEEARDRVLKAYKGE
jgi:hypothetical protein